MCNIKCICYYKFRLRLAPAHTKTKPLSQIFSFLTHRMFHLTFKLQTFACYTFKC